MPRIKNLQTGEVFNVAGESADRLISGGGYQLDDGQVLEKKNVTGTTTGADNVLLNQRHDLSVYTGEEEADKLNRQRLESEHDTVGSRTRSLLGGGADMLSLGFVNPWQEDQEFHPNYSTAGKGIGLGATLLIPGAGEANAGRAAVEGGVAAGRLAEGASAVGKIARWTPLGLTTRAGEAAEGLIGGTGLASRVGRVAVNGATQAALQGGGENLSHQAYSDDPFSGEQLLSSIGNNAVMGGAIGGVGALAAEGLGAGYKVLRERVGRAPKDFVNEAEALAAMDRHAPKSIDWKAADAPHIEKGLAENFTKAQAVDNAERAIKQFQKVMSRVEADQVAGSSAIREALQKHGIDLQDTLMNASLMRDSAKALREGKMTAGQFLGGVSEHLHQIDRASYILGGLPEGSLNLPKFLSREAITARTRALEALSEAPARRGSDALGSIMKDLDIRLTGGTKFAPGTAAKGIFGRLVDEIGGRIGEFVPGFKGASKAFNAAKEAAGSGWGKAAIGVALAGGGVGALAHGVGAAAPVVGGLLGAGALVKMAFGNAKTGGLVAARIADAINSTARLDSDHKPHSSDPRRAIRDLGDRARSITPEQAAAAAASALAHHAGTTPSAVNAAAEAAGRRHAALLAMLDRVDPPATTAGPALLGRPLPSSKDARDVARFIQVASSPTAFIEAAQKGQLTPEMMATASSLWPATVDAVRNELLMQLANGGAQDIPVTQRKAIETMLGDSLGAPTRTASYQAAVARSIQSSKVAPPQGPMSAPSVKAEPPSGTPAMKAASPGKYR